MTFSRPLIALLCCISAIFGIVPAIQAQSRGSYIDAPDYMNVNEWITAASGNYFLMMQSDSNLVLYAGSDPAHNNGFIWANRGYLKNSNDYTPWLLVTSNGKIQENNYDLIWQCAFTPNMYPNQAKSYRLMIHEDASGAHVAIWNGTYYYHCNQSL